jgi:hypothetical protein
MGRQGGRLATASERPRLHQVTPPRPPQPDPLHRRTEFRGGPWDGTTQLGIVRSAPGTGAELDEPSDEEIDFRSSAGGYYRRLPHVGNVYSYEWVSVEAGAA